MKAIYQQLCAARAIQKKQLAVLIDPDKVEPVSLRKLAESCVENQVDYLFVGGSILTGGSLSTTLTLLKSFCDLPLVLFPGSHDQVDSIADAILLLSLISGRNPEYLIGQHVTAAPKLKQSGLEILPTGYLLIESGNTTTVQYVSNTVPIPAGKPEIAACTALAGEQLGMKLIFAEAGSGAEFPVPISVIEQIRAEISIPLIVGGGIRTPEAAYERAVAGADLIVVGNVLEKDPLLLADLSIAIRQASGLRVKNH
jgi:putative glycerol-1-phosphate prenyltransferase